MGMLRVSVALRTVHNVDALKDRYGIKKLVDIDIKTTNIASWAIYLNIPIYTADLTLVATSRLELKILK